MIFAKYLMCSYLILILIEISGLKDVVYDFKRDINLNEYFSVSVHFDFFYFKIDSVICLDICQLKKLFKPFKI